MSGLVLWSSLLSLAWSEQVYYSPLSTQCPDASHSAAFLSHNDIFLFDHDVTGEFPDIKRSGRPLSARGAFEQNERFPNFPDKESHVFGFQNVQSELVDILDDLYRGKLKKTKSLSLQDQNEQLFVLSELSGRDVMHKRSVNAMKPTATASEKSRARNDLDSMVNNTKENWPKKGNNVPSSFLSERHQTLSKYEKSDRKRRNTQIAYRFQDSTSQKLQQTQLRSSMNQQHPTYDPQPSTTSIPEVLESSPSNRKSDSKIHQNLKDDRDMKRPVSKKHKSVVSSYHLQPQSSEKNTLVSPMERLPPSRSDFPKMQHNSGKKLTPGGLQREKHSGRLIQSKTAAWLNDLRKVNPTLWSILHHMNSRPNSSENLRRNNTDHMVNVLLYCLGTDPSDLNEMSYSSSEQETRTVHQGSKQKRAMPEHNISRPERTGKENKLPVDVHSTEGSEVYGSHVLNTVSKLAESAKAYRSSMLGNLQQQQPKLIKRLSFVHPRCLTGKLDFVKSTANIDADILQFLTELTDTVSPTNFSEVNPTTSQQNRPGLAAHFQQESQSGLVQPQRGAQLTGVLASLPTKQNRTLRSIGKRNGAAERFSPGSRLPWTCSSNTRWRDLGMHVFPRYVQETSCGGDNDNDNDDDDDNTPTCWYGFYHCRPTTSAVQVLVRHTGTCNDSRVPQNMRRHYFLSIISINTGCHCV